MARVNMQYNRDKKLMRNKISNQRKNNIINKSLGEVQC